MHRHGYKGRKLHRDSAQRTALMRGFAISIIEHGSIETTLPRAKEFVPFFEPIITKAKRGDLASRRAVLSAINNQTATSTLVDQLAPQLGGRDSGHVRIKRTRVRVGDNAQLARVSFVDDLSWTDKPAKKAITKRPAQKSPALKKRVVKSTTHPDAPRKMSATDKHLSHKPTVSVRKSGDS